MSSRKYGQRIGKLNLKQYTTHWFAIVFHTHTDLILCRIQFSGQQFCFGEFINSLIFYIHLHINSCNLPNHNSYCKLMTTPRAVVRMEVHFAHLSSHIYSFIHSVFEKKRKSDRVNKAKRFHWDVNYPCWIVRCDMNPNIQLFKVLWNYPAGEMYVYSFFPTHIPMNFHGARLHFSRFALPRFLVVCATRKLLWRFPRRQRHTATILFWTFVITNVLSVSANYNKPPVKKV